VGVTPIEIELAERLVDLVPSFERVLLTVTGSEATFHATRLARAATNRRLLVKFQGCYHGWHDAVAMNVISRPEMLDRRDPLSSGSMVDTVNSTIVLPFNDLKALESAFDEHGSEIAAVIVEPIPHNVGALLPLPGYLEGIRALCDRWSTVLIFDEVITGIRHSLAGYQGICGVTPDLTTMGKAMANGYPIGALGGRSDLMDMFSTTPGRPVFFAGTYNGNPPIAAGALATLDRLQREPVHEHIFRLGQLARDGLTELFAQLEVDAVVSGFGSVWVVYFLQPPVTSYADLLRNDVDMFVGYRRRLMETGFFELPLNLKRSHASYAHTETEINEYVDATGIAVEKVLKDRGGG
jgi:glutamate-1-semialdehyde 2,1-aminomutase